MAQEVAKMVVFCFQIILFYFYLWIFLTFVLWIKSHFIIWYYNNIIYFKVFFSNRILNQPFLHVNFPFSYTRNEILCYSIQRTVLHDTGNYRLKAIVAFLAIKHPSFIYESWMQTSIFHSLDTSKNRAQLAFTVILTRRMRIVVDSQPSDEQKKPARLNILALIKAIMSPRGKHESVSATAPLIHIQQPFPTGATKLTLQQTSSLLSSIVVDVFWRCLLTIIVGLSRSPDLLSPEVITIREVLRNVIRNVFIFYKF